MPHCSARYSKTPVSPTRTTPLFNILAGTAVAKGGELVVTGYITPVWEVVAGYAYTFSEITKSPTVGLLAISASRSPMCRGTPPTSG